MNARSNSLVSSTGGAGLRVVAGLRMHLAGTTYFSPSLSANFLTAQYAGCTPGMAPGILINFFDFFDFWGS